MSPIMLFLVVVGQRQMKHRHHSARLFFDGANRVEISPEMVSATVLRFVAESNPVAVTVTWYFPARV
jgi:hypothetical protein